MCKLSLILCLFLVSCATAEKPKPNIILVMTDDQGWGQAGYMNHPVLKTPNLNAMAANGLRFNRFYAAAPVCSPTRASVLTGRANDRTGVFSHGYALRLEEKALPAALKKAGYATNPRYPELLITLIERHRLYEYDKPGRLDPITRTEHGHIRHRPERRDMFDRLVGRAILAKAD